MRRHNWGIWSSCSQDGQCWSKRTDRRLWPRDSGHRATTQNAANVWCRLPPLPVGKSH